MLYTHAEDFLSGIIIKLGLSRTRVVEIEQRAVIHYGRVDVGRETATIVQQASALEGALEMCCHERLHN